MRAFSFLALSTLALACERPEPRNAADAAREAIDANNAAWARLTAAGHADSIAELYHRQGALLPPGMRPVVGREAIRGFFSAINTLSSPPPTLAMRAESLWTAGPHAVELGRWTFTWPPDAARPPGLAAVDSGKYMVRWVRESGRWLMMQNIWNSDVGGGQ